MWSLVYRQYTSYDIHRWGSSQVMVCFPEETKPIIENQDPKDDSRYYNNSSENSKACIGIYLHNKYSKLCLVYLHRTLVDVPMSNGLPPAATWAASAASAKSCCVQNGGKELIATSPRKFICMNDTQNMYNIKKETKLFIA